MSKKTFQHYFITLMYQLLHLFLVKFVVTCCICNQTSGGVLTVSHSRPLRRGWTLSLPGGQLLSGQKGCLNAMLPYFLLF